MNRYCIHLVWLMIFLVHMPETLCCAPSGEDFFHVRIEGTEIPVLVRGNMAAGKFVIYINGGPGATSQDVARADLFKWSSGLEENFAMVYYDQRGCGNAQGNFNESTLNTAQFIRDLDAIIGVLIQRYQHPDIYLMGASFGAFIGTSYLLTKNFEDKISGWISVDGAYNFDYHLSWQYRRTFLINIAKEEISGGRLTDHWAAALEWAGTNAIISTREQKDQWRKYIGWPGDLIIPEEKTSLSIRQYLEIGFASSYNLFPAYLSSNLEIVNNALNEDVEGTNLMAEVSKLTLPVLMIWGRYDDLVVPEEGLDVYHNFGTPDAAKYYRILPNSGHEPYISDPENFKGEIIEFVNTY